MYWSTPFTPGYTAVMHRRIMMVSMFISLCFLPAADGPDRAVIIDDRLEAGLIKIQVIEQSETSLDLAYHALFPGVYLDLFSSALLGAADQGVAVRLLTDGMFGTLRGDRDLRRALQLHPGIEIRFYEPFSLLAPWRWNNRLHDKLLIADRSLLIMGGANIDDRYYLDIGTRDITYDREVLVLLDDPSQKHSSVLSQAEAYFNLLWHHPFTDDNPFKITQAQEARAWERRDALQESVRSYRGEDPELFTPVDWKNRLVPTDQITLLSNPLERGRKEPLLWRELNELFSLAEKRIVIQSPYIIPNRAMRREIGEIQVDRITLLSNSLASSPNYPAMAGHANHRRMLARSTADLYEYHGPGSIHGKSILIDEHISAVGTFNIDPRSTYFSTESMLVIESIPLASQLEESLERIQQQSLLVADDLTYAYNPEVTPRQTGFFKRLFIALLQIITLPFTFLL
mgnify:CR=1 FL=1